MKTINYTLKEQRDFVKKLAKGIDPTSNLKYEEDTILNNPTIQKCFEDIVCSLDTLINIEEEPKKIKEDFYITSEELRDIALPQENITISHLAFIINSQVSSNDRKRLQATELTAWLVDEGFLDFEMDSSGNIWKTPTDDGKQLGIIPVTRINSIGKKYSANTYTPQAQQFIVDHLTEILGK